MSTTPTPTTNPITTPSAPVTPSLPEAPAVRKMVLDPWKKKTINIILIGETGVGKTAMLNLLANLCAGVELDDFQPVHFAGNEQGGSEAGSQTNKPVLYPIECADGHKVNILDTPGLGDTRGTDKDKEHKQSIADAIKSQMEVVDAIIILANGTQPRFGVVTEYALTVIAGMFPNSIVNNVGIIFTMVSDPTNFCFQRSSLQKELQQAPSWMINNPFSRWSKFQEQKKQKPPVDKNILKKTEKSVRDGYQETLELLSDASTVGPSSGDSPLPFFQWLDSRTVQPTAAIYSLYLMSTEIEASIANVIARMDQTESTRSELVGLQNNKTAQERAITLNKAYEEIISKPFYKHEDTGSSHNTLCIAGNCYSNCHIDCNVGFTMDKDTLGDDCSAFSGSGGKGVQRICQEKGCGHPAADHQHYRSKWVMRTEQVHEIDKEAEKRYTEATSEAGKIAARMKEVEGIIASLEKEIRGLEDELSDLCDKYNNLALSGSFIGYISSAIRMLKVRETTMKQESATPDALQRMAERIKLLEDKKKVIEDAEKSKLRKRTEALVDGAKTFLAGAKAIVFG